MSSRFTPIFIPGLILTSDLFAAQCAGLESPVPPQIANTLGHDSIAGMARQALGLAAGPILPIGLSMGGYVAMEMARLAPDRLVGLGLLNTAHKADDAARREQRLATIKMAQSDRFRGVTRHLLKSFLSPAAMADESLVGRVIAMAAAVGRENFVLQQRAILGRQDQSDTLRSLDVPVLVVGGSLDTLTPPARSEEIAALAPASQLLILEDVGHLSTLEAPQAVTDALNGFIAHIRHGSA
ncbi:MAG: alpha/beta fold hydrolase [Candidatus Puniceispirillaceae bacterium]